jgi:hypothetical protein
MLNKQMQSDAAKAAPLIWALCVTYPDAFDYLEQAKAGTQIL